MTPTPAAPAATEPQAAHAADFIAAQDREVRCWRVLPNGPGFVAVRYPPVDPDLSEARPADAVIETHPFDNVAVAKSYIRFRSTLAALEPWIEASQPRAVPLPPRPKVRHLRAGHDFPCALHKGPKGDCDPSNCRCN